MNSVHPRHNIPLYPSPERQHVAGIGAEFDVMDVDPALNLSGLMRAFEVTRDDIAVLDDFNRLQVASGPGDILGVDDPVTGDIVGRLFLHSLLRLGKHHAVASDASTQSDGKKMRSGFHGSFS